MFRDAGARLDVERHLGRMAADFRLVGRGGDGEGVCGDHVRVERQKPQEYMLSGRPGHCGRDPDAEIAAGKQRNICSMQAVEEVCFPP